MEIFEKRIRNVIAAALAAAGVLLFYSVCLEEKEAVFSSFSEFERININSAGAEEFSSLFGIGDVLAERIVEYRAENGDFSSIEEIKNVSGIGEEKFENIKNFLEI